jgi:hypothetical protein
MALQLSRVFVCIGSPKNHIKKLHLPRIGEKGVPSKTATIALSLLLMSVIGASVSSAWNVWAGSGPRIDVFSQKGGVGLGVPCDVYYLMERMVLCANATYNEWPEVQEDVTFQVVDSKGVTCAILFARTDEFGIAMVNFTLPYTDEECFGNWTILGSVQIAGSSVNDTLPFEYQKHAHNVRVVSFVTRKTTLDRGSQPIFEVTLYNNDSNINYCYLTIYANDTFINQTEAVLGSHEYKKATFKWDTSCVAFGNYTLIACAEPLPNETCSSNKVVVGWTFITIAGDLNMDLSVDIFDTIMLANAYNSRPESPNWNPNADLNGDNTVDIFDATILAANNGKTV